MTASDRNLRSLCGVDVKLHAFSKTIHISGHCGPFRPLWVLSIELGAPTKCENMNKDEVKDNELPKSLSGATI